MQWLWGASDTDVIDRLIFSATSDGIVAVIEDRQVPTAGATLFVGTGGSDSVIGSSHNDLIVGHGGDDTIDGRDGDDYLRRGAGSDRLIGGTGKNYLDGGDEEDTAVYSASTEGVGIGADVTYLPDSGDGTIVIDQTAGNVDRLSSIEKIELTDKADYIRVDREALQADVTIDMGLSDRLADFIANVDVVDYSGVGQGITFNNGKVALGALSSIKSFVGLSENLVVEGADKVVLTDSNDTLISADIGTIVETGDGNDNVWFQHGVGISDLSTDDQVSLFGMVNLYGGLRHKFSESPYATGYGGLVQYGVNVAGELVIRLPWGDQPLEMYILNWRSETSHHQFGGQIGPGNISLAEYDIQAVRLLDENKPSGYSYWKTWELFGLMTKQITGTSAWKGVDPLVLDLDGDGFELTAESTSAPIFDIDGDLYGEKTGWVRPDDGFLVRDLDGDGRISDSQEMFGGRISGFTALSLLDGNRDGKVDGADSGLADFNSDGAIDSTDTFEELMVWQDRNQNARTDAGELVSLDELSIASITVTPSSSTTTTVNGNHIVATGTFTRADGSTGLAGDVVFRVNNVDSVYQGAPIAISTVAETLPNLKSYGSLVSLHEAMSLRPDLIPAVQAAIANLNSPDLEALKLAIRPILQAWAKGSPIRLANGEIVTGDAGLRPLTDMLAIADGDDIKDYVYAHSGLTWSFASGTNVTLRNVSNSTGLDDFSNAHATETVDRVVDWITIDGVHHERQTYTFGSGAIIEFTGRFGVSSSLVSLLVDASDAVSWTTVSGADLAFFERYLGETFPFDVKPASLTQAVSGLNMALSNVEQTLELLAVRIAVQAGPLAPIFESINFDATTDVFRPDRGTDQLSKVYGSLIERAMAASDPIANLAAWKPFLDIVIGDYQRGGDFRLNSYGFLAQNIIAAFEDINPPLNVLDVVNSLGVPRDLFVIGTGEMTGTSEADIFYISGANQTAMGGGGFDNYIIGKALGHTVIDDRERLMIDDRGPDIVRFTSLNPQDVDAVRDGIDLLITVRATGETLRIKDQFEGTRPGLGGGEDLSDQTGVGEIIFADGTLWGSIEIARAVSKVDARSTTVLGTDAIDFLEGGAGDDRLEGNDDSDIYIFGRGDGRDTIYDSEGIATRRHFDTVAFTDGIRLSDLEFSRDDESLDVTIGIRGTDDSITIINQFQFFNTVLGQFWLTRIEAFTFDDGSSLGWSDLFQPLIDQSTTEGNDRIFGFGHRDDLLDGRGGDDFLDGRGGSDTYLFDEGYGHDTIADYWENILTDNEDKVVFGSGISADDVILSRQGGDWLYDLKITFAENTSDSLLVEGQFFYATMVGLRIWEVSEFHFSDGTVWTDADIRARYLRQMSTAGNDILEGFWSKDVLEGGAGDDILRGGDWSDTYIFDDNFGNDRIEETVRYITFDDDDQIIFNGSLVSTRATFERVGNDLVIRFDAAGGTLRLKDQFVATGYHDVELITFSDGVALTDDQLPELLLAHWSTSGDDNIVAFHTNDQIASGSGNDTISAGRGLDILQGGLGNDTLMGDEGSDTYIYARGDGHDVVDERGDVWSQSDVLKLTAINSNQVGLDRIGSDVRLVIAESAANAGDGGSILLRYQVERYIDRGIDRIEFSDGMIWTPDDIHTMLLSANSTDGDDNIVGFNIDDLLSGGLGNDLLAGGAGNDTYVYRRGDGHDVIDERDAWSQSDRLSLIGVTSDQVTLVRSGGDVSLNIAESISGANDGGRITIAFQLERIFNRGIDHIDFSDGARWTWDDILLRLLAQSATAGNDTIEGFNTNDTLTGGIGNDTLTGGVGNDTYVYARGDGADLVDESGLWQGTADRLVLSGIAPSEISLQRNVNDLTLFVAQSAESAGGGGRIIIKSQFDPLYERGVESIVFADGTTWTKADLLAMASALLINFYGTDAAETFADTTGSDVFYGSRGADRFNSNQGGDTFIYDRGDGNDFINDNGAANADVDVLRFSDLNASDIVVSRTPSTTHVVLTIVSNSETITLDEQLYSPSVNYGVDRIEFADGTTWNRSQIRDNAWIRGTAAVDTLSDATGNASISSGNDVFIGGRGNDILNGGAGSDTYLYTAGDGNDTIKENSASTSEVDVLRLSGINVSDVTLGRSDRGLDIKINPTGEAIRIDWQFWANGENWGIDRIEFADGTTLDRTDIDSMAWFRGTSAAETFSDTTASDVFYGSRGADRFNSNQGGDTFIYDRGDGNDVVNDNGAANADVDVLRFSDLSESDIVVSRPPSTTHVILTIVSTGETITLDEQLYSSSVNYGVDRIEFADGTSWTRDDISERAWIRGTAGGDTINGTTAADTFFGGLGNDVISGSAGSDTYVYSLGDGSDRIVDPQSGSGDIDTLKLVDLTTADISFARTATDLRIHVLSSAATITVVNQFGAVGEGIEAITFADGTILDRTAIAGLATTYEDALSGTSGNDTITGTSGADVIVAGLGNDDLNGQNGSDTYRYNAGDGADRILEGSMNSAGDQLIFGAGLNSTDMIVTRSTSDLDDVTLTFAGQTGSVFVDEAFYGSNYGIEQIVFGDGVTWGVSNLKATYLANIQTGGNDTVYGFGTNDTFTTGAGNDYIEGGNGSDTYNHNIGDGHDRIIESGYSTVNDTDKLVFGAGLSSTDVIVTRSTSDLDDITLSFAGQSGSVFIDSAVFGSGYGIEQIVFADGVTWGVSNLRATYLANIQTAGNDTVYGFGTNDTFTAGAGNDYLEGGHGSDTYNHNIGDGHDRIFEGGYSTVNDIDKLVFGAGLSSTDVNVTRSTSDVDDITISFAGQSGSVFIDSAVFGSGYGIEQIVFGDGVVWGVSNLRATYLANIQTAGNDTVYGFGTNDTFMAGAGNDNIEGGHGSDTYDHNIGDGHDRIIESGYSTVNDTDKLVFGAGLNSTDVIVTRSTSDLDDVTLSFAGQSGSVFIDEAVFGSGYGIEQIVFADGVTWNVSNLLQNAWMRGNTNNETITGTAANDRIDGDGGNDTISAGAGLDRLVGGAGNDTLTGGAGNDAFYFATDFGVDRIADFTAGAGTDDVIEFDDAMFADLSAVLAAASQSGADTIITYDGANSLKLSNVSLSALHADDFRFV